MSLHINSFFSMQCFIILVCMQYSGDLFVLVTDEHILMRFGEALWKRLAMVCDDTL